jgi:DNA repair protein RAD16
MVLLTATCLLLLMLLLLQAVEQQAQDRIHRLGQYKPIRTTRFVIAGTIEERILKLQDKKQAVFEGTVGRDAEALGRLTEDDLRFLFG